MLECGEQWAPLPAVKRRRIYSWCGLQNLNSPDPCPSCASPEKPHQTASGKPGTAKLPTPRFATVLARRRCAGEGIVVIPRRHFGVVNGIASALLR